MANTMDGKRMGAVSIVQWMREANPVQAERDRVVRDFAEHNGIETVVAWEVLADLDSQLYPGSGELEVGA